MNNIRFFNLEGREIQSTFVGDPFRIEVVALEPNSAVSIRATLMNEDPIRPAQVPWQSAAKFIADAAGVVDTGEDAPISGDYSGVDVEGLVWSAKPQFDGQPVSDGVVEVSVAKNEVELCRRSISRVTSGIVRREVGEDGLVGVFYAPQGQSNLPALIGFGGSDGGVGFGEAYAKYYSSLGYAVLGLAYFGPDLHPLPSELNRVPLEYFNRALDWLGRQSNFDNSKIGVIGGSRGGELALLLGSKFPRIRAVVAFSPSHYAWYSIGRVMSYADPAWTFAGKEIPFIHGHGVEPGFVQEGEYRLMDVGAQYSGNLELAPQIEKDAAAIKIEDTNGPILLLAGEDDRMWPSAKSAKQAFERLDNAGHVARFGDEIATYSGSGLWWPFPGFPTTGYDKYVYDEGRKAAVAMGGNSLDTAKAVRGADTRIRKFLKRALG